MADDDWDLPEDGEINSDPEDITLKPKVLPKFRLVSKKPPKKSSKKRSHPPFNSTFECAYPSKKWEIVQIIPVAGKPPQDVQYELVREENYFKLQVVVGITTQCYWLCTEIKPGVFDAWWYECERVIFGSRFFNPYTGESDDGIFGPNVYGGIVFGRKWEFVAPRFKQHIQML